MQKTTPVAQAKPGKENTHVVDDSKKIPKSGKRKGEANGNASTRCNVCKAMLCPYADKTVHLYVARVIQC